MRYCSAIFFLVSLLSFVTAVTWVDPADIKPGKDYALVTEHKGKLYALDTSHGKPTTKKVSEKDIPDVRQDNGLRWQIWFGIPKYDEKVHRPEFPSGRIMSVSSHSFFGVGKTPLYAYFMNDIPLGHENRQGFVADVGGGQVVLMINGNYQIGLHGAVDTDKSTKWRIAETTGRWG